MKIEDPILITGCARSGTSLVAACIHMSGAWGGNLIAGDSNNPKGYFENRVIREEIEKPLLQSWGCDKLGQNPLPDKTLLESFTPEQARELKARWLNVLRLQDYRGGPWFYKGAKMCLYWPLLHTAFPRAKWIIVRRRNNHIAEACVRTPFMRAYKSTKGWYYWISVHMQRFLEMNEAGLDIHYIWPQKMIDGNLSHIRQTIIDYGLNWNRKEIENFIEPKHWHS